MYIIDRYLLRQYVQNFLICFLSLTGLFVVFDAFTNLEKFVRCGKQCGGVVPFMVHYYAYKSIWFFDLTAGLLALIAAMFTVAWIQRHNEMTALLATGVPRIRVLRPVILAATAVIVLAAANRELVIPRYRGELARRPQDLIGDQPQQFTPCYDLETNVLLGGKHTYDNRKRIAEPEFMMPPSLCEHGDQLTAENAYYLAAEGSRPSGYLLDNVREPKNLDCRRSLRLNSRLVLIMPHDAPDWLRPKLRPNQCFLVSNLDFDQLSSTAEQRSGKRELQSTVQLISALRNPSQGFGADVRVAIHSRIVHPLLDITLLFLGLPLIITRESRNMFLAMGICMAVLALFSAVVVGMAYLGKDPVWISPALAAWAPLILFVPAAVGLADSLWS